MTAADTPLTTGVCVPVGPMLMTADVSFETKTLVPSLDICCAGKTAVGERPLMTVRGVAAQAVLTEQP